MTRRADILFRTLVIATFGLWFGGFTFYVSFVVPIGNEVLGSARTQGFVTQQVTNWLNVVCGCALVLMLLDSIRGRMGCLKQWGRTELVMLLLMGGFLVALIGLHPIMDSMIDATDESVSDVRRFYGLHRVYLWLSTFQWAAAWVWLVAAVVRWRNESERNTAIS